MNLIRVLFLSFLFLVHGFSLSRRVGQSAMPNLECLDVRPDGSPGQGLKWRHRGNQSYNGVPGDRVHCACMAVGASIHTMALPRAATLLLTLGFLGACTLQEAPRRSDSATALAQNGA